MSRKAPAWFKEATKVLTQLPNVSIDDQVEFFDARPRIAIRHNSLVGLGIIHRQADQGPFSLCVFEPSQRESLGFAEVFERHMASLDELPAQIEAWQKFRRVTSQSTMTAAQTSYAKFLQKTWRWKQKCATLFDLPTAATLEQRLAAFGIDVDIQTLGVDWPKESRDRLKQDIEAIVPELLAWHLPCDETGQWFLKRRIPLYRYDYDKRRMFDSCLTIVLPEKRSGRARLTTEWLNADSQSIRMDATPEYFDARVTHAFAESIIGGHSITPGNSNASGLSSRGRGSSQKATANQARSGNDERLLQLQYEGKFVEASSAVGLEFDDAVADCMAAKRITHMCTCCAELDEQLLAWSDLLKQTLLSLNLATLVPLLIRDQSRRSRPRQEPIPIIPFPLQRHSRKAHLAIDIRKPEKPRLSILTTGSMNRVPLPIWRRPIEIDILKQTIADLELVPEIVRKQFGWL